MKCPKCHFANQDDSLYCSQCATRLVDSEEISSPRTKTIGKLRKDSGSRSAIARKYEIWEELGKGGMGVVYKAEDIRLGRIVALKLLPAERTDDLEARERFIHEARAASALDHPNICTIYEIDETDEGQIFIAMAYCPGRALQKKIKRGPLPLKESIEIVIQVAQGLAKAHGKGIVHRDIKPANLMIGEDGGVKIVDFGLAKLAGGAPLTRTSEILGTVAYMSPEQAAGKSVDHRTDIWSLGVVFYQLLTGQLPFRGETEPSILHAIIHESPLPPTDLNKDIPEEAENIVLHCLQKLPERRYPSADLLILDLTRLKTSLEKEKEDLATKKSAAAGREMERRQATLLAGEILGYAEVLASLETEEAALVINRCLATLDGVVGKYQSRIDEIAGGRFSASFGIPLAIEDAPKKAINAAIELRNSLEAFKKRENISIPLGIRIGINSGTVVAGVGAADKVYSVIGEDAKLAAQLRDICPKNNIYVGPLTHRYTRNDFEFESLEPAGLEGRTEPTPVFKLLSVKERPYRARLGSERMIFSEMVGRESELNKLKLHVLKAINGEGSIVNLVGEAGLGKSRLLEELNRTEELKKVTVLRGRALSIGSNLSFHPVIDILKSWARIAEDDSPAASAQKIENVIRGVVPEGVSEVFPFVATLMGIKLTGKHAERIKGIEGDALEKLILKNIRDLIAKASDVKPLVFILEDLHWADSTSVDLFESLFKLAETKSVLFVNVMRPNYETSERILRTVRNRYPAFSTEIHLEPLDDRQCEVLIGNLLNVEALPLRIKELIAERAEGNPFFIEEVARSFIDDGVVEIENGRFRVTEKIDSVVIPESIHDVIMARVDKLGEQTKSLLRSAAVIGRNFFYKILTDVAASIEEIDDRLEHLKEVQLIKERRRMMELEYLFKHALVWDAVYNSILLKKRKQLHLDVARSIESVFRERISEFYGMLALHYSRGENLEKSEEYLIKAGEEALKTAASNEALNYFQEALSLYLKKHGKAGNLNKIARLEKSIALALYNKGHYAESLTYFDNVLEYLGIKRPKSKIVSAFHLLVNLSSVLMNLYVPHKKKKLRPTARDNEIADLMYRRGEVLSSFDTARFFMDSIGLIRRFNRLDLSGIENGTTHYAASSALFSVSGISFPISKKILDYSSRFIDHGDKKSAFRINVYWLLHDCLAGNWNKNLEQNQSLIDDMLKLGDMFLPRIQLSWGGIIKLEQGHFDEVDVLAKKLEEIGDEYEHDGAFSGKYSLKTLLLLKQRRLSEALVEANRGIEFQKKVHKTHILLEMLALKTNILLNLKDIQAAGTTLIEGHRLLLGEKRISPFYMGQFLLSRFLVDLFLFEEAIKSGEDAKKTKWRRKADQSGKAATKNARKYAAIEVEVYRSRGVYSWLVGKPKDAVRWWRKSLRRGKELRARPELGRTYGEIGKRLMGKKGKWSEMEGKESHWYLNEAEKLFRALNLEWDMEELIKLRTFEEDK